MQCPICHIDLVMSDRQGVEIDYCPKCRGVWLDRGELDKIIEKSSSGHQPSPAAPQTHYQEQSRQEYSQQQKPYQKHHKKENFLMDLFDF